MTSAKQLIQNTKQRAKIWQTICDNIAAKISVNPEHIGGYIMCAAYQANGVGSDSLLFATTLTENELCEIVVNLASKYAE